jgi:hypothetical protein
MRRPGPGCQRVDVAHSRYGSQEETTSPALVRMRSKCGRSLWPHAHRAACVRGAPRNSGLVASGRRKGARVGPACRLFARPALRRSDSQDHRHHHQSHDVCIVFCSLSTTPRTACYQAVIPTRAPSAIQAPGPRVHTYEGLIILHRSRRGVGGHLTSIPEG